MQTESIFYLVNWKLLEDPFIWRKI